MVVYVGPAGSAAALRGLERGQRGGGQLARAARDEHRRHRVRRRAARASPAIRANSSPAARRPIAAGSCATTVIPGESRSAVRKSSKPTRATSRCRPNRCSARTAPIVTVFWRGEQRRRRVVAAEERERGLLGQLRGRQVLRHERRVVRQPGLGQRGAVAGEALAGGADRRPVAEVGDAGVAGGDQVAHALASPRRRGSTSTASTSRLCGSRSTQTTAVPARSSRGEVGLVVAGRDEDQPVRAARGERRGEPALPLGVLVDARGEHHHPAGQGDVLDRALDARRRTGWRRRRAAARSTTCARGRGAGRARRRWAGSPARRSPSGPGRSSAGDTPASSFTTRETVLKLTPATAATSRRVGRLPSPMVASPIPDESSGARRRSARGWWCPRDKLVKQSGSLRNRDSEWPHPPLSRVATYVTLRRQRCRSDDR